MNSTPAIRPPIYFVYARKARAGSGIHAPWATTIRLAIMLERKRVLLLDVFRFLIGPTSIGWR